MPKKNVTDYFNFNTFLNEKETMEQIKKYVFENKNMFKKFVDGAIEQYINNKITNLFYYPKNEMMKDAKIKIDEKLEEHILKQFKTDVQIEEMCENINYQKIIKKVVNNLNDYYFSQRVYNAMEIYIAEKMKEEEIVKNFQIKVLDKVKEFFSSEEIIEKEAKKIYERGFRR